MIHDVVSKCVSTQAAIFLTDEHLHLFINDADNEFYVDLMQDEHKFLVRDFEGAPIVAWYCAEERIPVDVEVIRFLTGSDFICSRIDSDSNDYVLSVNMYKTCKNLTDQAR